MATILLVFIYIGYVGLGIPDSLLGTAWPAIYVEFGVSVSAANAVIVIISIGTLISSFLSGKLIEKMGTPLLVVISTFLTVVGLFGFFIAKNIFFLCLFGIPLGLGAGAVDAGINGYVAEKYSARQVNFLHCFYGIGVVISPYLMSLAINGGDWRRGYLYAGICQAIILLLLIISLPIWKKAHPENSEIKKENLKVVKYSTLFKTPSIRATWVIFIVMCGIELTAGTWCATYLVSAKGISEGFAAKLAMCFYLGLTLSRFLTGVLTKKLPPFKAIIIGYVVLAVGIIVVALSFNSLIVAVIGIFIIGLGTGPLFPSYVCLTPKHFGGEIFNAVVGTQTAFCYVGVLVLPALFGFIAKPLGLYTFPYYIAVLWVILLIATAVLIKYLAKEKRAFYGKKYK